MSTPHLENLDDARPVVRPSVCEYESGPRRHQPQDVPPGDVDAAVREPVPQNLPRFGWAGVSLLVFAMLLVLSGLFVLGYRPTAAQRERAHQAAAEVADRLPVVSIITPRRPTSGSQLTLPANLAAFQQTAVYPRANGYLRRLLVDIGDRVAADELLAELDTPELDAQITQMRAAARQREASLEKAKMDLALAQTTLDRYDEAGQTGAVARQELDERRTQVDQARAGMNVAVADLEAARAEIQQLEALKGFARITAPFAGVVTARNYDVGALLSPENRSNTRPLFQMEQTDTLRVFVNVPQPYAISVQVGQDALVEVNNYPGRNFGGKLVRTAGSIDPATRTLRAEIHVPNGERELYAGMYGRAKLQLTANRDAWIVPTGALVYNADGLSLATLNGDTVAYKKVAVGRDYGTEIEVLEGVLGDDRVIANPGEHIREGSRVRVAPASQPAPGLANKQE